METNEQAFVPLPEALAQRLNDIAQDNKPGICVRLAEIDPRDHELEQLGYLSDVRRYRSGHGGTVVLTSKGARYADDLAAYIKEKQATETMQETKESELGRKARRHDWATVAVSSVSALVGAAVGSLVTYLLTR